MTPRRFPLLLLAGVLLAAAAAFLALDGARWLSLAQLQAFQHELQAAQAQAPWVFAAAFVLLFVLLFALALPAGSVMSLAGGALFGFGWGVVLVSFASTWGATLAFLAGRYLLAGSLRQRFATQLAWLDAGLARDGGRFLFSLRLVPVIPPALLSVLMGLTALPTWRFYWVSQLGMLSGTLIYVNAGTQLAQLRSVGDILSPRVLLALALVALAPWVWPWLMRGVDRAWGRRPRR